MRANDVQGQAVKGERSRKKACEKAKAASSAGSLRARGERARRQLARGLLNHRAADNRWLTPSRWLKTTT